MIKKLSTSTYKQFLESLKERVITTRLQATRLVNRELLLLYHHIGSEIITKQQKNKWGSKVVTQLSKDLIETFPSMKGFSPSNLKYMKLFAQNFTEEAISQQAAGQLPWFHIVTLLEHLKAPEERNFYIQKAVENGWSRAVLLHQIDTDLYSRQGRAITNFKEKLPSPQSELAHQSLKDPYIFNFLEVRENILERDIEQSLITHMEKFLLELGAGFAFLGRQHYLHVGGEDFYIDLLFYHIHLQCFVVTELKTGKFKPEYAGKMSFYLSAIDETYKRPTDNPSIGIILCRSKNEVLAEYTLRDTKKAIGVAEYRATKKLPQNLKKSLPTIEALEQEFSQELTDKNKKTRVKKQ